jgi:uncharacterized protein with PIN domain
VLTARFLLDRSLGQRVLADRLRGAGWDVRTLADEFGDERAQRMNDEEWIGEGATAGYFLLAKDHRIAARPLEAHAIYVHDARVIVFARGDLTAPQMGDLCVQYGEKIHALRAAPGPFVFSLSAHGLARKRLNAPV